MSQARLAAGLLASLLAMGSVACGSSDTGPARFVVVTIDTLRADRVGAYGHDAAETPTLDGLAERGVRFTHDEARGSRVRGTARHAAHREQAGEQPGRKAGLTHPRYSALCSRAISVRAASASGPPDATALRSSSRAAWRSPCLASVRPR